MVFEKWQSSLKTRYITSSHHKPESLKCSVFFNHDFPVTWCLFFTKRVCVCVGHSGKAFSQIHLSRRWCISVSAGCAPCPWPLRCVSVRSRPTAPLVLVRGQLSRGYGSDPENMNSACSHRPWFIRPSIHLSSMALFFLLNPWLKSSSKNRIQSSFFNKPIHKSFPPSAMCGCCCSETCAAVKESLSYDWVRVKLLSFPMLSMSLKQNM